VRLRVVVLHGDRPLERREGRVEETRAQLREAQVVARDRVGRDVLDGPGQARERHRKVIARQCQRARVDKRDGIVGHLCEDLCVRRLGVVEASRLLQRECIGKLAQHC